MKVYQLFSGVPLRLKSSRMSVIVRVSPTSRSSSFGEPGQAAKRPFVERSFKRLRAMAVSRMRVGRTYGKPTRNQA